MRLHCIRQLQRHHYYETPQIDMLIHYQELRLLGRGHAPSILRRADLVSKDHLSLPVEMDLLSKGVVLKA